MAKLDPQICKIQAKEGQRGGKKAGGAYLRFCRSPQPRPAFIFTTKHFLISWISAILKFFMPDAITAL